MNSNIYWILELDIQPARMNDLENLVSEMVSATEKEKGTLNYEWSVSADGMQCHIFERYSDSVAAMTHLATFDEKFAKPFGEILTPKRLAVYGVPSAALKDKLARSNPNIVFLQPMHGFSR